ncbi:hypothetical protein [Paraburkholderia mimosarum]|uniref:hypothetical protein n=1 Tax=Paraburkholderia mimosarum TaxID=312026 RepID=UPI00138E487D|nr:hypothetical protein [Paraburkholderia mimosarum]
MLTTPHWVASVHAAFYFCVVKRIIFIPSKEIGDEMKNPTRIINIRIQATQDLNFSDT